MHEQQFLIDLAKRDPTLHADLAKLAQKWPRLTARAIRAAKYYLDNHVEQLPSMEYEVRSETRKRTYIVTYNDINCSCADVRNGAPPGPGGRLWCKHMIAATLHYRYQEYQREVV